MNAVVDALRPWGVNDVLMPATPERVWRHLHGDDGTPREPTGTVSYGGAQTNSTAGSASSTGLPGGAL
jgi:carbon-monoxide dehydrogenase large subunit